MLCRCDRRIRRPCREGWAGPTSAWHRDGGLWQSLAVRRRCVGPIAPVGRSLLAAYAVLAIVLGQAEAQLPPPQRRCLHTLDRGFAKVAQARSAHGRACLLRDASAEPSRRADCLTDASDPRTRRAKQSTIRRVTRACPAEPPFGATNVATVIDAATTGALLLTYDLFSGQVDRTLAAGAADVPTARCQRAVLRVAQRCQAVRDREFATCKRRGARNGSIASVDGLAACIDVDPQKRVARACGTKLETVVAGRCAGVDPAVTFPGCPLTGGLTLARCLDRSLACGACSALGQASGVAFPCDQRDDGIQNASCADCPPAGRLPTGATLYEDLVTYVQLGVHRTGTAGTTASARWLSDQLARVGFTVEQQPFDFTWFDWDDTASRLVVDGRSYDFVPLWFPATGSASGELALADGPGNPALAGKVALVSIDERILTAGSPTHLAIQRAIDLGAIAVVALNAYRPEAVALNVSLPFDHQPWPVPVVVVGARHRGALEASIGRRVTVSIAGAAGPATAVNVVARWTPTPGAPTFVVSTPYTGWFATAAERGPGIALFLALARWVAERRPGANYVFVAFAGMELGELGERAFVAPANVPPPPTAVAAWLHLGAGIVTVGVERDGDRYVRTAPEYGFLVSTPGPLREAAACGLADAGQFGPIPATLAGGSLAVVFDAGYDAFGLQTTNDLYHTAEDVLGRNEPDGGLLQAVAVGLVRAMAALGG